jgi:hypothetical protein
MNNKLSHRRSLADVPIAAIDSLSTTDEGLKGLTSAVDRTSVGGQAREPGIGSAIRRIATALSTAVLLLALAASAGATGAEAASGEQEPRIVEVEGFAFQPKHGKGLRVAALVLSRYPDVEARDYPKRLRQKLRFRAHAKLDVFDGTERIARSREAGSLPVAAKRHSIFFVHLLAFSRAEGEAILAAGDPQADPARALRVDGDGAVETTAVSALVALAKGKAIERSHAEEEALVGLSDQAPPKVINGCMILPGANCSSAILRWIDLSRVNLSGANLSWADLSYAVLASADLHGADIHRAQVRFANLYGANLSGANLSGANLNSTNLSAANLTGANLTGAYLGWTNLTGADLTGADLTGATFCNTPMPDGSINNPGC